MFFSHKVILHENDSARVIQFQQEYTEKFKARLVGLNNIFGVQSSGDIMQMSADGVMTDLPLSIFNTVEDVIRIVSMVCHRKYSAIKFDLSAFNGENEMINTHISRLVEQILNAQHSIDIYTYITLFSISGDIHLRVISPEETMVTNNEWVVTYMKKFLIQNEINLDHVNIFRDYIQHIPVYTFELSYSNDGRPVPNSLLVMYYNLTKLSKDVTYLSYHSPMMGNTQSISLGDMKMADTVKKDTNSLVIGTNIPVAIGDKNLIVTHVSINGLGVITFTCKSANVVTGDVPMIGTSAVFVDTVQAWLADHFKLLRINLAYMGFTMTVFNTIMDPVTDIMSYMAKLSLITGIDHHGTRNPTKTSLTYDGINVFTQLSIYNIIDSFFFKAGSVNTYKNVNMFTIPDATIAVVLNNDNCIQYKLKRISSMDELLWNVLFVYSGELKVVTKSLSKESILAEARKTVAQKQYLQELRSLDPVTFGSRTINGKVKQYSGNAQNITSRVCAISEQQYELLSKHSDMADSILKMPNQADGDKMLYLLCPYAESPVINFHDFPNQNCIVKCTMKQSNPKQIETCARKMGITDGIVGASITPYSPDLQPGQLCMLPSELAQLFAKFGHSYYLFNPVEHPANPRYTIRKDYPIYGVYHLPQTRAEESALVALDGGYGSAYVISNPLAPDKSYVDVYGEHLMGRWISHTIRTNQANYVDGLTALMNRIFDNDIALDGYKFERVMYGTTVAGYNVSAGRKKLFVSIPYDIGVECSETTIKNLYQVFSMDLPAPFSDTVIITPERETIACQESYFTVLTKRWPLEKDRYTVKGIVTEDTMIANLYSTEAASYLEELIPLQQFVHFWLAILSFNGKLTAQTIEELVAQVLAELMPNIDERIAIYEEIFAPLISHEDVTKANISYHLVKMYVKFESVDAIISFVQYGGVFTHFRPNRAQQSEQEINNF